VLEGADPVALVWPNGQTKVGQSLSSAHGFYMKAGTLDDRYEVDDLGSEHDVCVGHAQASHEVALALMPGTNEKVGCSGNRSAT
jgi:hypothetical protein